MRLNYRSQEAKKVAEDKTRLLREIAKEDHRPQQGQASR
jgi:hypothetical protein